MFLDLSGSTGATEALGPERSRDLLSAMQTLVEREVTAHRGVVINYMGDGFWRCSDCQIRKATTPRGR